MSRKKVYLSWLWVALCSLAIFLIVPTARTIQSFVSRYFGRSLFGYSVIALTVVVFATLVYVLFFRLKIRSPSNYIWLTAVAFLYIYYTHKLWRAPEEAVHFLEYGLLGYFLFQALSFSIKDKTIYLAAILIGSLVGIFDEILQWIVPGRLWDIRDVELNAFAVALFQVSIWKGINPKIISQRINPRSVKRVSLLLGMNLVLLGLCLSNNPKVIAWYSRLFPALSPLQNEEPMDDFRYKHKDSEIGAFYSRLTIEELRDIDSKNASAQAEILNNAKDTNYEQFLRSFSSTLNPFLHEIRVHIYRRDKKFEEGQIAENAEVRKKALFISYKENLILEKYFTQTIRKTAYKWDEDRIRDLEGLIDKNFPYTSPVSKSLFGSFNGITLWSIIVAILFVVALFNLLYSRSQKSQHHPIDNSR
mgnify:CR=1 FL=1